MGNSKGMFGLWVTAIVLLFFIGNMGYNVYRLAVIAGEEIKKDAVVKNAVVISKEEVDIERTSDNEVVIVSAPFFTPLIMPTDEVGGKNLFLTVQIDGKEYRIHVDNDVYGKVKVGDTVEVMKNEEFVWIQSTG